jgi:hypothetical protein
VKRSVALAGTRRAVAKCQNSSGCEGVFPRIFVCLMLGDLLAVIENTILAFLIEVSS